MRRLCAVLALALLAGSCRADRLDIELEKAIGSALAGTLEGASGVVVDPLLVGWVERVGAQVAAQAPPGPLKPRFVLLDSAVANAWTAPGGTILVTRGLLESVASDDELAAVLAHETGHVSKRHAWQQISENALALGVFSALKGQSSTLRNGAVAYNVLRALGRSRSMELQADELGAGYTAAAGYDPRGLAHFLGGYNQKASSPLESYLATHPDPAHRLERLSEREPFQEKDPAVREKIAAGLERRGLTRSAARLRAGRDPLALPPLPPVTLNAGLAAERSDVIQRSQDGLARLRRGATSQRAASGLQQLLLLNTPLTDLRALALTAHAYALQQRVSDTLARAGRTLAAAPGTWDRLSALPTVDGALGRDEVKRALERAGAAPAAAEKAQTAAALALAELNGRFIRPRRSEDRWARFAAIEGLLRLAESTLRGAERDAQAGWELLSAGRVRAYAAQLDTLSATDRSTWRTLFATRFGDAPAGDEPVGAAAIRRALALQRGWSDAEAERGRGGTDWVDWVRQRGDLAGVATALRALTLDLERETLDEATTMQETAGQR